MPGPCLCAGWRGGSTSTSSRSSTSSSWAAGAPSTFCQGGDNAPHMSIFLELFHKSLHKGLLGRLCTRTLVHYSCTAHVLPRKTPAVAGRVQAVLAAVSRLQPLPLHVLRMQWATAGSTGSHSLPWHSAAYALHHITDTAIDPGAKCLGPF